MSEDMYVCMYEGGRGEEACMDGVGGIHVPCRFYTCVTIHKD